MPVHPSRPKLSLVLGKRLGRTLSGDEVLRLAAYARALKSRRSQQRIYKPRMELLDDGNSPLVTAIFELPGLRPDQVAVDVVDGRLIVSGERCQRVRQNPAATEPSDVCVDTPKSSQVHLGIPQVRELKYGFFRRVFPVPVGCTSRDLDATMENGMLTVSWPRHPLETLHDSVSTKGDVEKPFSDCSDDVVVPSRFTGNNPSRST
ncbi:hypothetical protein C8Q74DRAFT_1370097 [Fomes fomentarius]|nr:hypothetical protein C8Q74DRAFT_1370097 [Fomes fomentarius]